jgi:hypothetical protein
MRRRITIAFAGLAAALTLTGSAAAGFSDGTDASPAWTIATSAGFSDGVD